MMVTTKQKYLLKDEIKFTKSIYEKHPSWLSLHRVKKKECDSLWWTWLRSKNQQPGKNLQLTSIALRSGVISTLICLTDAEKDNIKEQGCADIQWNKTVALEINAVDNETDNTL